MIEIGSSIGRYHILEQLGQGGMATVYKAFDTRLERQVAIKVIRRSAFSSEALEHVLKRFDREAKSLARLTHPNIVSLIDYGEFENSPYLVMPYLPGGTVKQFMGKPMAYEKAIKLLLPIADALRYSHQQGIVHRDVKPANILINEGSQPMLTDFGIARLLENEDAQTLTGTGVGVGTPVYMSPEQGIGKEVDGRSDIYSLGVVLYELVTGHKPYIADTPMAIVLKQATEPLPSPRKFVPELPQKVEQVLFKALAKKPEDRYPDMVAFAAALESLAAGTVGSLSSRKAKENVPGKTEIFLQESEKDSLQTVDRIIPKPQKNKPTTNNKFLKWGATIIVVLMVCFSFWGVGRIQLVIPRAVNTPIISTQKNMIPTETIVFTPALLRPTETIVVPTQKPTLDIAKFEVTKLQTSLGGNLNKIAISPDGKQFAVATSWGLYIFDSRTLSEISRHEISSWINDVAYSPDGGKLVAGSDDGRVIMWDVKSGELLKNTYSGGSKVLSIAFSPDGKILAEGRWNHTILLWDVENWDLLHEIKIGNGFAINIAFSPNGQSLIAGMSNDNAVMVWDVESGSKLLEIDNDNFLYDKVGVSYLPNCKAFASGTINNPINLWNSENGSLIRNLPGQGNVFAFSPDGHVLASASMDKIQLWDIENNVLLRTLDGNMNSIKSVVFSSDGQILIAGYSNGYIFYWKIRENG